MYLGSYDIDDNLTFTVNTHRADTGAATDADTAPSYRIYEDENGTALYAGSMALLDDSNTVGLYSEQISLTSVSGFERGKCYNIRITATVNSVAGAVVKSFQVGAKVDLRTVSGDTQSLADFKDFVDAGYDPSTNKIEGVKLADTLTTYTSNTPQTGDSYARLGAPVNSSVVADISAANVSLTTITARIGAWTGTGVNTILGAFKALASKTASVVSDIGGTFDPAADSLEAATDDAMSQTDIANAVLNETRSTHSTAGTVGETVINLGNGSDLVDVFTVTSAAFSPTDTIFEISTISDIAHPGNIINRVLYFKTGNLSGQRRTISNCVTSGSYWRVTLDSACRTTIVNGDTGVIA